MVKGATLALAGLAAGQELMGARELNEIARQGGLTGAVRFKVKRDGGGADTDGAHVAAAGAVASFMGCGEPVRVFPPAGKHEAEHKAWGFDLWYESGCLKGGGKVNYHASGFNKGLSTAELQAAGAELAGKFDLLRAAPAALMAELDKVEPDYSITMADLPGDAAAQIDATMRAFLDAERDEVGSGRRLAEEEAAAAREGDDFGMRVYPGGEHAFGTTQVRAGDAVEGRRVLTQGAQTCAVGAWSPWPSPTDCDAKAQCEQCDYGANVVPGWKKRPASSLMDAPRVAPELTALEREVRSASQQRMARKEEAMRADAEARVAAAADKGGAQVRAITTGASCEGGTADGYPCEDVDLVQYTPISTVLATMNWGWTDPDSGGEWAIQASYSKVVFIYMGDAQGGGMSASIQYEMALHNGGMDTWSDVKTYGNWLLHGSEKAGHGVQILDLKKHLVPHSGSAIALQPDKWWGGFGPSHNLVVNEETSLAFGVDVSGGDFGNYCGLYAFDIRDPMNPVGKGCLYSGSTHDAQCVLYRGPDEAYFGKEICFVYAGYSGLVILDITDLNNPKTVASISSYVNMAYTHQGWINCQHDTVFFGDEVDEKSNGGSKVRTFVVDVSTLSEANIMNVHVSGVDSIDHNQYVCGGFVYQSNYESGLRILDGSQAQTNKAGKMTEVAYFDIFPDRDAVSFMGTWNVWPYFKSGRVVIGDIGGGLAVVRPTNLLKQARQRNVDGAGDGVCPILLEERACADLTPTKAPTAKPDAVEGDDPLLSSQTNNPAIDAAGAWAYGAGTPDVIVQVVDTGLQLSHEEHQVNIWQNPGEVPNNGLDDDNNGYVDDYNGCNHADNTCTQLLGDAGAPSHGTHCSGTIAASRGNGLGIAGLAGGMAGEGGARLMTSVGFGVYAVGGFGPAIAYGADNGAKISSNSWGYTQPGVIGDAESDAIKYARSKGTLVVFAAGNGNSDQQWLPAYMEECVAVAATDDDDKRASFSNYGAWVDIAAPGVNVLSTFVHPGGNAGQGYQRWSGTSFSCPTVSGMIAMCWSVNKALSDVEVLNCLYSNARNIDDKNPSYAGKLGAGQLGGGDFLQCCAEGAPSPRPTFSMEPTGVPTSSAPSISPAPTILACGKCEMTGRMVVKTDNYAQETAWQLSLVDEKKALCKHDASQSGGGSEYTQAMTVYTHIIENMCEGVLYEVKMTDTWGDGNCCTENVGYFKFQVEDFSEDSADGWTDLMPFSGSPGTGDAFCGADWNEKHADKYGACKGADFGKEMKFPVVMELAETFPPTVSPHPTAAPVLVCYGDPARVGDGICDGMTVGAKDESAFRGDPPMASRRLLDEIYNTPNCDWDGGDCCKCTCEGPECGGKSGINFNRCLDPDWIDKNDWDDACDGSTAAPVAAPAPTAFSERAAFSNEHLVGISWGPAVAALAWQTPPSSSDAITDWTLSVKDVTNGGPWTDYPITVDAPTQDHWYLWQAYGDSVKGQVSAAFPFDCSTLYYARVKSLGGEVSDKVVVDVPYCPGECIDSESWYFTQTYKDCKWVKSRIDAGASASRLCAKTDNAAVSATDACPNACDQCGPTYKSA